MSFLRRSGLFVFALGGALLAGGSLRGQNTTPAFTQPLPPQTLLLTGGAATLNLQSHFALPGVTGQVVQFDTVLGRFNVELLAGSAPVSVANFLSYVADKTYDRTIIHRSARLGAGGNGIVQGGGYTSDLPPATTQKKAPIALEYNLPNARGTIAMARTDALNSATSEWFFNLDDNTTVLGQGNNGGYAVFGRVLGSGMTVVDAIGAVPAFNAGGAFAAIPLRNVISGQANIAAANLIVVNSVAVVPVFPAAAGGASVLALAVTNSNPAVVAATLSGGTLTLTPLAAGTATVTVTATDTNNNSVSGSVAVLVATAPSAPAITAPPPAQLRMASGTPATVVLSVGASGIPLPAYQWRRNGRDLAGQTAALCVLSRATDDAAGNYTCVVSNSVGSVESAATAVSFVPAPAPARLGNLSILTDLAAEEKMTMGTVLGGAGTVGTKALLARAAGPALGQFGLAAVLPDPQMTLGGATGVLATNDNWNGTPALTAAFAQVGAFPYASQASKDAALFQAGLAPGGYVVQVSDAGTGTGAVIAELYDATPDAAFAATTPRLINVSVRKQIAAGNTLTVGFVIGGTTAKTVLVRAMGPSLTQFGLTDVMTDPQLALYAGAAKVAENDNWGGDAQLAAVGASVGAFAPASPGSRDALLLLTLSPGNYSAQASGSSGGGQALVEVYEVP